MLACFLLHQFCPLMSLIAILITLFQALLVPAGFWPLGWFFSTVISLHGLTPGDTILLRLWVITLPLILRRTVPCLLSLADPHLSGRLWASCPSLYGCCSTQCLSSLEGSFKAQKCYVFCTSVAHWWQSPANRMLPASHARKHLVRAGAGIPFSYNVTSAKNWLWVGLDFALMK